MRQKMLRCVCVCVCDHAEILKRRSVVKKTAATIVTLRNAAGTLTGTQLEARRAHRAQRVGRDRPQRSKSASKYRFLRWKTPQTLPEATEWTVFDGLVGSGEDPSAG